MRPRLDVLLPLPVSLPAILRDTTLVYLDRAMTEAGGCKTEAARLLGIPRTTLIEKLKSARKRVRRT